MGRFMMQSPLAEVEYGSGALPPGALRIEPITSSVGRVSRAEGSRSESPSASGASSPIRLGGEAASRHRASVQGRWGKQRHEATRRVVFGRTQGWLGGWKPKASERERAYIDALARRYSGKADDCADRDRQYADAIRELSKRFPEDLDAAALFAEPPGPGEDRDGRGDREALPERLVARRRAARLAGLTRAQAARGGASRRNSIEARLSPFSRLAGGCARPAALPRSKVRNPAPSRLPRPRSGSRCR